jgi:hypothetical protein
MHAALLDSARKLLEGNSSAADRKRAASTAYYAIFHHLCEVVARMFLPDVGELSRARVQAYRSIDHGPAKAACNEAKAMKDVPRSVAEYADRFAYLQNIRHSADYDPLYDIPEEQAHALVQVCAAAISAFDATDEKHRRAFAVLVALRKRAKA